MPIDSGKYLAHGGVISGEYVRAARAILNWSQKEFARRAWGCDQPKVSACECGRFAVSLPRAWAVNGVLHAYGDGDCAVVMLDGEQAMLTAEDLAEHVLYRILDYLHYPR